MTRGRLCFLVTTSYVILRILGYRSFEWFSTRACISQAFKTVPLHHDHLRKIQTRLSPRRVILGKRRWAIQCIVNALRGCTLKNIGGLA